MNIGGQFIALRQVTICCRDIQWGTVPWASEANSPVSGHPLQHVPPTAQHPPPCIVCVGFVYLFSAGLHIRWGQGHSVLSTTVAWPPLCLAVSHLAKMWCLDALKDLLRIIQKEIQLAPELVHLGKWASEGQFFKLLKENLNIAFLGLKFYRTRENAESKNLNTQA